MKYAVLLLSLISPVFSQASGLTVEWRPTGALVTNASASAVTAIAVGVFKQGANNRGSSWSIADTIDAMPGNPWLAPGESKEVTLNDSSSGVLQDPDAKRVVGAMFADGSTFGDPDTVHFLQQGRRAIASEIPPLIARLQSMAASGENKAGMIKDLNASRKSEMEKSRDHPIGELPDPNSLNVAGALQRTVWLIDHGPDPVDVPSLVQKLQNWQHRLEGSW